MHVELWWWWLMMKMILVLVCVWLIDNCCDIASNPILLKLRWCLRYEDCVNTHLMFNIVSVLFIGNDGVSISYGVIVLRWCLLDLLYVFHLIWLLLTFNVHASIILSVSVVIKVLSYIVYFTDVMCFDWLYYDATVVTCCFYGYSL